MPETNYFEKLRVKNDILKNPVLHSIKEKPLLILTAIGLTALPAVASYLIFVYLPSYLTSFVKISSQDALFINTLSMMVMLISIPIIGRLSDRFGRKLFLILGCLAFILFSYPLFNLLSTGNLYIIFLVQSFFGIIMASTEAVIPATLSEMFQTKIRYTGIALSLNIANGVFGGLTPLFATFLIQKTHFAMAPSIYLVFFAILTLSIVLKIKETYKLVLA